MNHITRKLGIIGDGQLGRMLAQAANPLGIICAAINPSDGMVRCPLTGRELGHGVRTLISESELLTFESEHIPLVMAEQLMHELPLAPSTRSLVAMGDRLGERALLGRHNIPCAAWRECHCADDVRLAEETLGYPLYLKRSHGGYDGRGQWRLTAPGELPADLLEAMAHGVTILAEAHVPFVRELSILAARGREGQMVFYPLVENSHHDGILHVTIAPAPGAEHWQQTANDWIRAVAEDLDHVGMLAIELFDTGSALLVNELAPRVHNSGHWSQRGASHSQFENHVRAVCGLPLQPPQVNGITVMLNVIGEQPVPALAHAPGVQYYWYCKAPRAARKLGHINLHGHDYASLLAQVEALKPLAGPTLTTTLAIAGQRLTTLSR
ncbi:MAG: 5-(carboxyamino)imidazole ribonucleotide synthase [Gammaproteobacteria bacterium]|nr:5-(carboxyamino)imidazole ribonucleotide synthase [Gammaproteobacteria bacterium]